MARWQEVLTLIVLWVGYVAIGTAFGRLAKRIFIVAFIVGLMLWAIRRPLKLVPLPKPPSPPTGECAQCGISLKPGRTGCHWCGWEPSEMESDRV